MEVRGDGAGPPFPLDLHRGRPGGHGRDHLASAHPVRRPAAVGHPPVRDRVGHGPTHGRGKQGIRNCGMGEEFQTLKSSAQREIQKLKKIQFAPKMHEE